MHIDNNLIKTMKNQPGNQVPWIYMLSNYRNGHKRLPPFLSTKTIE
jgi:hypothetical protein